MLQRWLPVLCALFVVSSCTEETPTDVGDGLLPSGSVRTFEVVLDADEFLTFDTTFSGFTSPRGAPFYVLANQFQDALDANALFRFASPPAFITVRSPAGGLINDSTPAWFEGRIVLRVDTTASESEPEITVHAFRTAEEWDNSASWTMRVDTGSTSLAWSTPGGTRGPEIETVVWTAGDSIVVPVDSSTLAFFFDTTNAARGALIVAETPGSRLRLTGAVLRASAHSDIQQDTVVNVDLPVIASTFIFNPEPPPGDELRVGGVPSWRTMFGIRDDLAERVFPCPGVPNCSLRLASVHINRAELLMQPVQAPAGFLQEDTTLIQVRTLSITPGIPLERSPIGVDVCGGSTRCLINGRVLPETFGPGTLPTIAFDVTNYIVALVDEDIDEVNRPPLALTLVDALEPSTFGFSTFAQRPRLRLVLTTTVESGQ